MKEIDGNIEYTHKQANA